MMPSAGAGEKMCNDTMPAETGRSRIWHFAIGLPSTDAIEAKVLQVWQKQSMLHCTLSLIKDI